MAFVKQDVLKRFEAKYIKAPNGCYEWQSTLHRDGYGKFWYDKKQAVAHRVSYLLYVGEIPEGLLVLHKCDNRKCVNPEHLYAGTAKQNMRDKVERCDWWGRMKMPFKDIQKIRAMYSTGEHTQADLAELFGCHQAQVSKYVLGKQRLFK